MPCCVIFPTRSAKRHLGGEFRDPAKKNSERKHDEKQRICSTKNLGKYIVESFGIKGRSRDEAESEALSRGQGRVPTAARGGATAEGRPCLLDSISYSARSLDFPNFLKINNIIFLEFSEGLFLPKQLPIRLLILESSGIWSR